MKGGVWNDSLIRTYCEGFGLVQPYDPALVNPCTIDLRLGNTMRRADPIYRRLTDDTLRQFIDELGQCDFDLPTWGAPFEFETAWIMPGEFVLCHSLETVRIPTNAVAHLYSKSSMGRTGLEHLHAGLGDPGFVGQWTWEWHNVAKWPIKLIAGKRYMQMEIVDLVAVPLSDYSVTGRYQNQTGPTVSRG